MSKIKKDAWVRVRTAFNPTWTYDPIAGQWHQMYKETPAGTEGRVVRSVGAARGGGRPGMWVVKTAASNEPIGVGADNLEVV